MNIKGIFKAAYPFLSAASIAGGPIAMAATKKIGTALGIENLKPDAVEGAIAEASAKDPDVLERLKRTENEFQLQMTALGFDSVEKLERIAADDRANARAREIAVRDKIPATLAIVVTLGFFSLLGIVAFAATQETSHDILVAMIGVLGTAWLSIINYYFGSSSGSAKKTEILANGGNGNVVPFKAAS